jgi:hypothetical protein
MPCEGAGHNGSLKRSGCQSPRYNSSVSPSHSLVDLLSFIRSEPAAGEVVQGRLRSLSLLDMRPGRPGFASHGQRDKTRHTHHDDQRERSKQEHDGECDDRKQEIRIDQPYPIHFACKYRLVRRLRLIPAAVGPTDGVAVQQRLLARPIGGPLLED